jgi:hypothetical protein
VLLIGNAQNICSDVEPLFKQDDSCKQDTAVLRESLSAPLMLVQEALNLPAELFAFWFTTTTYLKPYDAYII